MAVNGGSVANVAGMSPQLFNCSPRRLRHVPLSHEDDKGGLRVAPDQVPEQLVYRAAKTRRALPELAFSDEDRPALEYDEDVRLSRPAEGFSGCRTKGVVQQDQENVAQA